MSNAFSRLHRPSSARIVLTHALKRNGLDLDELGSYWTKLRRNFDSAANCCRDDGERHASISVVDADMKLVAWNRRYLEMFNYPGGLVYVGRPVADLIRWNAQRGEFGVGDPEQQVAKRLAHMRAGTAYTFQRERSNGKCLALTVSRSRRRVRLDVHGYHRVQAHEQALLDSKQELEARVAQRTGALRSPRSAARR